MDGWIPTNSHRSGDTPSELTIKRGHDVLAPPLSRFVRQGGGFDFLSWEFNTPHPPANCAGRVGHPEIDLPLDRLILQRLHVLGNGPWRHRPRVLRRDFLGGAKPASAALGEQT